MKYIRRPYDPKKPWTWQGSGCWKDKKHTKAPWQSEERDILGEPAEVYVAENVYVRLKDTRRDVIELDGAVAPEIEQRRLNLLWPSIKDSEYRANHGKVRAARDARLSIAEMAKLFKVSERTINYRLADIPDTIPSAHKKYREAWLALSKKHGTVGFWPGADFIPQGSTETRPSVREKRTEWVWLPVPLGPCTLTQNNLSSVRAKREKKWLNTVFQERLHAPYDSREENLNEWRVRITTELWRRLNKLTEHKFAFANYWKSVWRSAPRADWTHPAWAEQRERGAYETKTTVR